MKKKIIAYASMGLLLVVKTTIIAYALMGLMIVVLSMFLLAPIIIPAFGYNSTTFNDTIKANVTVSNTAPIVGTVLMDDNDSTHATMVLSAGNTTNVIMCNATITDVNGYQDVTTVNATFWLTNSPTGSTFNSATDTNTNYFNSSCALNGTGTLVTAKCTAAFEYEALNGTWNCTISAIDGALAKASNSTTNSVDQLVAVNVNENSIHFGTMANYANSTTANTTNVTNFGNVKLDLQVVGTDMPCMGLGTIGVGNLSFNVTGGNYDTMVGNKLSTSLTSLTTFNLVQRGMGVFSDTTNATNLTYWTINVPGAVKGECTNNITVVGLLSTD